VTSVLLVAPTLGGLEASPSPIAGVDAGADAAVPLAADLEAAGLQLLGGVACTHLVREAVRLAPDVVVVWAPVPEDALFEATRLLQTVAPCAVLVFTAEVRAEPMEQALASGVHAWVVNGCEASRLRPLVQLVQARFRIERALRSELAELQQRYQERKLVDRAKGILMQARQVSEDEAFRLLRSASMHSKLRVGQVSQQLIDAAHYADAINRSGRLRMLSQRIVKLYALLLAGVEGPGARALLADSRQQAERILVDLGKSLSRPSFGDLLDAAERTWSAMRSALDTAVQLDTLATLDAQAESLLTQAERLTASLAAAGPVSTLQVINVAGRQRMLSQRLAKEALLASLLPARSPARSEATAAAFEAGLASLREAPLSSVAIRSELDAADAAWQQLRTGARGAGQREGRSLLARSSEDLLERLDRLTHAYEHSLQLLIGGE
jgi:AmiR/NasT family two-component response regulator